MNIIIDRSQLDRETAPKNQTSYASSGFAAAQDEFGVYRFNVVELIGLKKFDTNAALFDFLSYDLCEYMAHLF